jgi:histidyl-tRNA synthetase
VQAVVATAPSLMDYLGEASLAHFEGLRALLDAAGLVYAINPKLVRGLDYYNLTVFEWISDRLGAQGTVCGGGRYDGLFAQIGGKPAPASGFAMGSERLIALMREARGAPPERLPDAYVVAQGEGAYAYAFLVAEALRNAGFSIVQHAGEGSFKSQMKKADASKAWTALIVGEDEMRSGEVSLKPLRREAQQLRLRRDGIVETFAGALAQARG